LHLKAVEYRLGFGVLIHDEVEVGRSELELFEVICGFRKVRIRVNHHSA
jgi:hypothetical protein